MIHAERHGRVLVLNLDNPPHNFLDRAVVLALDELTRRVERDPSIGAVVLESAHPATWVAHYDVSEILAGARTTPRLPLTVLVGAERVAYRLAGRRRVRNALLRTRLAGLMTLSTLHRTHLRMNAMDKVFVAAIDGFTVAGGLELALACDVRVLAEGPARVGMLEPLLGFVPGGGGGQRLSRAVGPARATALLLQGRMLDAHEARDVGLVDEVVPRERVRERGREIADRMARRSPSAIRAVKRSVYEGYGTGLRRGLALDRSGFVWAAVQAANQAAMERFVARVESLDATSTPSPWADPEELERWQVGTAFDFSAAGAKK